MKILCVDSATEAASCAILDGEKLLGEITFNYKKQHSVLLMNIIDSLLKNTGTSIDEIHGYVVSKGPGSFTGLRIGMATIKGLSQGSNKPFISVSTLDSLAFNLCYTEGIICPILDALRNNVYTALYRFNGSALEPLSDHMSISIDELILLLKKHNENISFVGDGIYKFKDILKSEFPKAHFAPIHLNIAKASSLGELGLIRLLQGEEDDVYTSAPIYLRKSQAEREYEEKHKVINNER